MDESSETTKKRSHDEMVKPLHPASTTDRTHERTSSTTVIEGENLNSPSKISIREMPASTDLSEPNAHGAAQYPEHNDGVAEDGATVEGSSDTDDPKMPIEGLDWEDLEERFRKEMAAKDREEREIYEDFNRLMAIFVIWSQEGQTHENDRALKRLKTRMNYVQGSEKRLRQKSDHYQNVVKAFESALALLT
ncbi:MAG: hypothetical protein M1835_003662, partial [Candelina submexicana]